VIKKILILSALTAVLVGCEDGSYFSGDTIQMKADKVGRLEAVGTDLRVYEFTPQTDPRKQCIFVAGEKKAGLQCWDKRPSNTRCAFIAGQPKGRPQCWEEEARP